MVGNLEMSNSGKLLVFLGLREIVENKVLLEFRFGGLFVRS